MCTRGHRVLSLSSAGNEANLVIGKSSTFGICVEFGIQSKNVGKLLNCFL